jgi:hypothetical protein
MPFCPSCGAEFRAGFTECNNCNVMLVDSLDSFDEGEFDEAEWDDRLRLVESFDAESDAVFARQLLDGAGIPSVLKAGHESPQIAGSEDVTKHPFAWMRSGATPPLHVEGGEPYRVFVDDDYYNAAVETLEYAESPLLVIGRAEEHLNRLREALDDESLDSPDLARLAKSADNDAKQLQASLYELKNKLNERD